MDISQEGFPLHLIQLILYFIITLGFLYGSAGKESACNAGDLGSIPGLARSSGGGKGYPLQYSGLENSIDYIGMGSQRVGHDWATSTFKGLLNLILFSMFFCWLAVDFQLIGSIGTDMRMSSWEGRKDLIGSEEGRLLMEMLKVRKAGGYKLKNQWIADWCQQCGWGIWVKLHTAHLMFPNLPSVQLFAKGAHSSVTWIKIRFIESVWCLPLPLHGKWSFMVSGSSFSFFSLRSLLLLLLICTSFRF